MFNLFAIIMFNLFVIIMFNFLVNFNKYFVYRMFNLTFKIAHRPQALFTIVTLRSYGVLTMRSSLDETGHIQPSLVVPKQPTEI